MNKRGRYGLWAGGLALLLFAGCNPDGNDPPVSPSAPLNTPTGGSLDTTPTATAGGETATQGATTPTAVPATPTALPDTPTGVPATPTKADNTPTEGPSGTPTQVVPPTQEATPTLGDPTIAETAIPTQPLNTPTPGVTPTPGPTPTGGGDTEAPTATEIPSTPEPTATATLAPTPTVANCGNGAIDEGEQCDDGDRDADDGCSPDCELEEGWYCQGEESSTCIQTICGDGLKTPDEACDDGDANSDIEPNACRTDCTDPTCGDGVEDAGELCDDGAENSDDDPNACRTTCTLAGCGDGILDLSEECDDGAANSDIDADSCRTNCTESRCGDGVKDTEEFCDEGLDNSDVDADACRLDCALPTCGDSVLDSDELCDNGEANSDTDIDACRTTCEPAACGDGILDTGEQCDDGAANSDDLAGACRTTCRDAGCGDGILDEGEACDDGELNSDDDPDACRSTCVEATCGDGIVDEDEACDEGDENSDTEAGACRTTCEQPVCGDAVTDPGEGCDDGNDSNTDDCSNDCAPTGCGDGFLNDGEECDDGAANSDEDPDACRTTCVLASCGDGTLDDSEVCDDGVDNSDSAADACRGDCSLPTCGDGVQDADEDCDDGEANGADGICSDTCTVNFDFEEVLVMGSDGSILEGDWNDFYDRITEDVADCKVRFDGRIAQIEHIEYATNSIYLDFQPLYAYHDNWDAFAYLHLNKGVRAGLGSSYRRGHASYVALKDRVQHAESTFNAMNVTVMCPIVSGYEKIASFNTRGEITTGSYKDMRDMIVERGATCKIRADKRIMNIPHIEYDGSKFYFDVVGLEASHNTWDSYAYAVVDLNNRAGLGASYRRGHGDNVHLRDRDQHAEAYFASAQVDVYCADEYESVATILGNGRLVDGDWDDLWTKAVDEGRSCKFHFDERITTPEYMEYTGGNLRFDFAGLHAYHDSYDSYGYYRVIEGGEAGIGTSYRKGNYASVWKPSIEQHGGDEFDHQITEVFCEKDSRWEHVYTITSDGQDALGEWDDFYDRVVEQGADCKTRFDGRIGEPPLVEYTDGYLLFDHKNLSAMHNSWDAYATHVIAREASSGLSASYRRGNAELVWKKDREQNSLYALQAYDTEFLCRRPPGFDPNDALCGDGSIDSEEECDDGNANSDSEGDACRNDCTLPTCGDGVVDSDEECDEGDLNSNTVGSTCSSLCTQETNYELVLSMTGEGSTTFGSFSDLYQRVTEEAATCKIRFDDRIAEVSHVEYSSNNIWFDFQGLAAYHDNWDAYAYVHLYKGSRAGLGSSYRRGHATYVSLKDRIQHAESEFYPMPVDVFCERENPYQKIASFNTSGQENVGSFEDLYQRVTQEGASCKVRVDRRIFEPEHIEYGDSSILFDAQNLSASHNTWDAFAYVEIDQEVRAGLGASYRRGHDDNVALRDREQHAEALFNRYPVDVYCADDYEEVLTITRNGRIVDGEWDDLFSQIVDEGRNCKVAFDRRIAPVEYTEFFNGDLRMEFQKLHGYHDSYDALAYALFSEGGTSGIGATYRRGNYSSVWKRSLEQHGGGDFTPQQMTVLCENTARWDHVFSLSYDGYVNLGDWRDFHELTTEQVADCKIRMDGRMLDPTLLEYTETELLLDQANLAAMHNSWDAYASNVLRWEEDSGISASYRRGSSDLVWAKDRKQNTLYDLQLFDTEVLCKSHPAYALPGPVCGDGDVDLGEECDDGDANSDSDPEACRSDCTLAYCGDGVIDDGEACDDGADNSDDAGTSCSSTCETDPYYERVLRMSASGVILNGDWSEAYTRITEEAADCKVRFDERVAKVEHVEYSSNNLFLDFQPLSAYHDNWDAYAYIHLSKASRAGLGSSYRRGHGTYVHLKDRVQHAESTFSAMTVDLYCARENPYALVASISSSGAVTNGSFDDMVAAVEQGATCKIRADKRVMAPPHAELADGLIYFDMLGLNASHNTWDAYAYAHIEEGVKAGLATSYRRGHDDNVYQKDRAQHAQAVFLNTPVDVYCSEPLETTLVMEASGAITSGDWDDAYKTVAEDMRTCKVAYDSRVSEVPYTEFYTGNLRMEFAPLHAYHDSYDAFAYSEFSPGDNAGLGASYRRGNYANVWMRSQSQHGGGDYTPMNTALLCEDAQEWEHVMAISYDGSQIAGEWDDLYDRLVNQAADCKVVFDGRVSQPVLVEYRVGDLLLDYANLAAMHNSWDAYATHPVRRGGDTGISASYRRGHADTVAEQDRDQNSLYTVQAYDLDFYCR